MTIEQVLDKNNINKKIQINWCGNRILKGVFVSTLDSDDNVWIKINNSKVWWSIKNYKNIKLMEE